MVACCGAIGHNVGCRAVPFSILRCPTPQSRNSDLPDRKRRVVNEDVCTHIVENALLHDFPFWGFSILRLAGEEPVAHSESGIDAFETEWDQFAHVSDDYFELGVAIEDATGDQFEKMRP
jgi:hypothetical protein